MDHAQYLNLVSTLLKAGASIEDVRALIHATYERIATELENEDYLLAAEAVRNAIIPTA